MIRLTLSLCVLLLLSAITQAQTLSGCHYHGSTEYCYGPDGEETAVSTSTSTTATSVAGLTTRTTSAPGTRTTATSGAGTTTTATSGAGTTTGPAPVPVTTTGAASAMNAVTDCHLHGSATYCIASNSVEVLISGTATTTGEPPAQYTDCHAHGAEQYCVGPEGEEVQVLAEGSAGGIVESPAESEGEDCHFHAGVEHCVGHGESETAAAASSTSCELRERDYNIRLRVGTLFVILVTSSIAVFGPILLTRFFHVAANGLAFTIIKQFGTGVIISTALIHLVTHAQLMFSNPCLGELTYEATTTAIVVAGLFLSFLLDYIGHRAMSARRWKSPAVDDGNANDVEGNHQKRASGTTQQSSLPTSIASNVGQGHNMSSDGDDKLKVMIMEAGIIFHSTIIGVTLVVAGDSFYLTLFVVILFHQMFEGIALGARLSNMKNSRLVMQLLMALAFALVTPVGMAIGLGVLKSFNGNDRNTIVAMGTLDALSAGILLWSGIVDMWSRDWMFGPLSNSGAVKTTVAMGALAAGLALMGLLGKWA